MVRRTPSLSVTAGSVLLAVALLLGACADADGDPGADGAPVTDVTDATDAADETSDVDQPTDQEPSSDGSPTDDTAEGDQATAEPVGEDQAGDDPSDDDRSEADAADPVPGDREQVTAPDGGDCSSSGQTVSIVAAPELPAEVDAARRFLIDAALRCDEQLLFTAIEESDTFTASFGADVDPIGLWWELEAAGEQPFLRLAQVLATTPAIADGDELVVWPRVHTGRAEDTTAEAWDEVAWVDDPAAVAASGDGYLDWRAGIAMDGQWRFFVRGD